MYSWLILDVKEKKGRATSANRDREGFLSSLELSRPLDSLHNESWTVLFHLKNELKWALLPVIEMPQIIQAESNIKMLGT